MRRERSKENMTSWVLIVPYLATQYLYWIVSFHSDQETPSATVVVVKCLPVLSLALSSWFVKNSNELQKIIIMHIYYTIYNGIGVG